ncbi:MAG: orotidine 5'-phosphate decarboxylase [Thaumarchaeota archaeon]|nr:orotidine 5'-phosphate decarboxylase [Nitrososphaerota archaeon]
MTNQFPARIKKSAENHHSRIVLALDIKGKEPKPLLEKTLHILKQTGVNLAAVKLNYHLLLPLDLFNSVATIINEAHNQGLQAIADLKINDISSTNTVTASYLWDAGFDSLIANPFVGLEEGLGPVITAAHEENRGIILLVYMSHKGAEDGYGLKVQSNTHTAGRFMEMHELFLDRALSWGCDGIVVGATRPETMKKVSSKVQGKLLVFSPGVGAQGGSPRPTIQSGADFLIVGRSILDATSPAQAAEDIRRATWRPF